jgi:hypothetical protein
VTLFFTPVALAGSENGTKTVAVTTRIGVRRFDPSWRALHDDCRSEVESSCSQVI